ncbi:MAG: TonB-dependent receptor [Flavobacteriales bacterium]|nr:TonB-dependent receptor [Flavobacteriales bacterium]
MEERESAPFFTSSLLHFFTLLSTTTFAQQPADTLLLKEFEVSATRLKSFAAGTKVQQMDSSTMARYAAADLGELLANASPVFIKSYGLGSLATTSFRGGSANHTAVLWNGLDLNSPMNGQIDLSLIPVGVADEVSVQYGGSTALWGSGAVGGAIHLSNTPRFGRGLHVDGGIGFGSFGDRRQRLRVELAKERWVTIIAAYNADALNGFTYMQPTPAGPVERTQTNAAMERRGVIAEQHLRIAPTQRIGLRYWFQDSDRRIPPTRLQHAGTAYQLDASHRLMADWQRSTGRWATTVRAAWFNERLDWYAAQDADPALSRASKSIAEAEMRYRPGGPHAVDVGVNHTHARALTDGYPDDPRQDRSALFAMYRYRPAKERFTGTASARQEWMVGNAVPFTGSIGAEYRLRSWATLKAHAARVYRVPTFNDLYWLPGGNPALLPEDGWSADVGVALQRTVKQFALRSEITWFNRMLDNWIIWLPGPAYWTPQNIMQVWSRGVETDSEIAWKRGTCTYKLGVVTNHVVSTNQIATGPHDASVDKQLIYVPMYSGNARIGVEHARASFILSTTYTGYRYTSTDNRDFLDPYWLLNASASVRVVKKTRWQADVFAHANNLLDTDHEVMLSRPMPLRNYQAGIRFHFDRPDVRRE